MPTASSLGWIGAASAVAIAACALIAGHDDDARPRAALQPSRLAVAPPISTPIVEPLAEPAAGAASLAAGAAAQAESPAAPPAPEAARLHTPTPARLAEVESAVMRLRERGGGDDDAYRARALALSPETAARIAEREQAERDWQQRVAAYLAQRERLLAGSGHRSDAEQAATLTALRHAHFQPDELQQLAATEPAVHPQLVTE